MKTEPTPFYLWAVAAEVEADLAMLAGHANPVALLESGFMPKAAYQHALAWIEALERFVRRLIIAIAATISLDPPGPRSSMKKRETSSSLGWREAALSFRLWESEPRPGAARDLALPRLFSDSPRPPPGMKASAALARRWAVLLGVLEDPIIPITRAAKAMARWRAELSAGALTRMSAGALLQSDDQPDGPLREVMSIAGRMARAALDPLFQRERTTEFNTS